MNTKALPSGEVLPTKNLCAENCAGCNDPAYGLMVGLHKSIQLFCDNIFTRGVRVHVQVRCSGCFSTFHSLCVRRRSGHVGQSQQREFLCMSCHGNGTGND